MFGIAVFAAVLFGSATFAPQVFAGGEPPAPNEAGKVTICHNGDDGPETIEVSGNAVSKHIEKHGDSVGPCDVPSGPLCADLVDNMFADLGGCESGGSSVQSCAQELLEPYWVDAESCVLSSDPDDACFETCDVAAGHAFLECLAAGEDGEFCFEQGSEVFFQCTIIEECNGPM